MSCHAVASLRVLLGGKAAVLPCCFRRAARGVLNGAGPCHVRVAVAMLLLSCFRGLVAAALRGKRNRLVSSVLQAAFWLA